MGIRVGSWNLSLGKWGDDVKERRARVLSLDLTQSGIYLGMDLALNEEIH